MRSLRDWTPGNSVRNNAHHQQAVLALRELQGRIAGILPGEEQLYLNGYPAMIVDEGPNGEADFTDARYWVKRLLIDASEYGDALTFAEDWSDQALADQANAGKSIGLEQIQATPSVVPATNLAEWATGGGSHGLPTDGTCLVWIVETDAQGHDEPTNLSTLKRLFSRVVAPFTARVASAAQDGSNKRWVYSIVESEKTTAGYGGWTDKAVGRTGNCYNRIEDQNGASGLYGNGVNSTNLIGTFDVQPIPDDTLILVDAVALTDGTTEWWTSYENGIDGECS